MNETVYGNIGRGVGVGELRLLSNILRMSCAYLRNDTLGSVYLGTPDKLHILSGSLEFGYISVSMPSADSACRYEPFAGLNRST